MNKERTVWFGVPVFIMRPLSSFLVATGVYLVVMLGYVVLVQLDVVPLKWLLNPVHLILVLGLPAGVLMVLMLRFAKKIDPFRKQLIESGGRVCFVCGYEIAEGLDSCS